MNGPTATARLVLAFAVLAGAAVVLGKVSERIRVPVMLAFPSRLVAVAPVGLALGLFLAFVARPAIVALCLAPFRYHAREKAISDGSACGARYRSCWR